MKKVVYEEDSVGIEYIGKWTEENDTNIENEKLKVINSNIKEGRPIMKFL